jgi:hypothetical protein
VKKVLIRPSPQEYCVHPREDCRLDTVIIDLAMIHEAAGAETGIGAAGLGKAPVIRTASCGWSGVAAKQHRATVDVHTAAGILAVDARGESGVETRVGFAEMF